MYYFVFFKYSDLFLCLQFRPGLGEKYAKLLANSESFKGEFQDVNLKYKMNNSYDHLVYSDDMKDVAETLKNIILRKKTFIDCMCVFIYIWCGKKSCIFERQGWFFFSVLQSCLLKMRYFLLQFIFIFGITYFSC